MRSGMPTAALNKVDLVVREILSDKDDACLGVLFIAKNVNTNTLVKCAVPGNYDAIRDAHSSQSVISMYSRNMHNDTMLLGLTSDWIGIRSPRASAVAGKLKRKRPITATGDDAE